MKIFLLDLWHDLREKRMWPVAAVLLVGLVAVPVLLAKPAEKPDPAPIAEASAPKRADDLAALARVTLGKEKAQAGSTLGVFDPSDPFRPPKGLARTEKSQATATAEAPGSDGSSGGSASAPDTSSGGGSDTGSDGGTGGGTTGGGDVTPGDGGGTTETAYRYVVDLTFSTNERTRRIKGLEKLDMLPDASAPLLIFMGVTPKGSNAVFLVDSTLDAAGEGRCKPSGAECAFAYIGAGSEYVFTAEDGDTYTIRIDEIRKVRVSDGATVARGAKARASVGPQRRFVPPVLADVVVTTGDELEDSNLNSNGR